MLGGIADINRAARQRGRLAVQHPADGPDLRDHAGPRSRRGRGRRAARSSTRRAKDVPKGAQVVLLGPGPDDEQRLLRPAVRPARRDRADLSADRRQLPVLGRSVRHHHRAAGRARRHRLDAVRDRHDAVGAGADRRDHVHGRRDRQQRAGHQLRARAARRARRSGRRPRSRRASSVSARC